MCIRDRVRDVEDDFQNLTMQNWDDYFSKHTVGETYISYTEEFTEKLIVSYLNKKLNELGKKIKLKIKFDLNAKSKILVSFQKNTKSGKAKPTPKGINNNLKKNKTDESEIVSCYAVKPNRDEGPRNETMLNVWVPNEY